MSSMASRILRATRDAARAARSAATSAASRCAAAAEAEAAAAARSGSGGGAAAAASADPLARFSSVVAAPAARSPASSGSVRCPVAARQPPRNSPAHGSGSTIPTRLRLPEGWVQFEAEEKDLESDEALWALYERWCKHFNEKRDPDEMVRRFSYFKDTVLRVEENKRSDLPYILGINQFADGKLRELLLPGGVTRKRRMPYSASPIYGSEFLFNEEEDPNKEPAGQAAGAASARACSVQWLLHSALATVLHSRPVSNPSSA